MTKRKTFRVDIPYFVEAHVAFGAGHHSMQRVLDIGGSGLRFLSNREINIGEKRKISLRFPFIFDPLSLEIEVVRTAVSKRPASGGTEPEKSWEISCKYINQTLAREGAVFQYVRFLERRKIAYKKNGLHRVDIPDDLPLFLAYGEEWYKIKHKVKNLSENGLLYEADFRLEPGTTKTAYLGFPWTTERQKLSLGVVRISEKEAKSGPSVRLIYELGCRLENLHQETQEKLYDHMIHMKKYGVSPKKRVAPPLTT